MTTRLLSDLTEKEVKTGLEETIKKFTSQLMNLEDPIIAMTSLRVNIGEEKHEIAKWLNITFGRHPYEKNEEVSMHYNRFPQHINTIEGFIELYNLPEFDESKLPQIYYQKYLLHNKARGCNESPKSFSATYRFSIEDRYKFSIFYEQPIDHLSYFMLMDSTHFRDILEKGSTDFYDILQNTVHYIWKHAGIIKDEIKATDEFKKAQGKEAMRLAYLKGEFNRSDRIIPLLEEMKLVYQTAIEIIKGISREYSMMDKNES